MRDHEYTFAEAAAIAGRNPEGPNVVTVICGRHVPAEVVASVQEDPRFGFVLRTGGVRGKRRTVLAFLGNEPTTRYVYVCPQCGNLRPDPSLLDESLMNYRHSGARQKLIL